MKWEAIRRSSAEDSISKDYSSCCRENMLDYLEWRQGIKQGDELESLFC